MDRGLSDASVIFAGGSGVGWVDGLGGAVLRCENTVISTARPGRFVTRGTLNTPDTAPKIYTPGTVLCIFVVLHYMLCFVGANGDR